MPDWEADERGGSDEDAAWRELVARFDAPLVAEGPVPWPAREDTPSGAGPDGTGPGAGDAGPSGPEGGRGGTSGTPPSAVVVSAAPAAPLPYLDEDDHFVPPPPPPLPKLDPLTKGAWFALFGGPGYLLVATTANWNLPGIAVFCAVAAFVAGVAMLVFRLTDSDRDDADDDGAVV